MACGIALACSGDVACGQGEAPMDEWETREWRAERSSNPAWTAGRDAAVSGWDCLPSAQKGFQKCENSKNKVEI